MLVPCTRTWGPRGGAVGWGTELQTGFDTRWWQWNSSSFRPHYDPEDDATSDRSEYQEYFLVGGGGRITVGTADKLTTFTCRLSWNLGSLNHLETSEPVQACNGIAYFYLTVYVASQSDVGHYVVCVVITCMVQRFTGYLVTLSVSQLVFVITDKLNVSFYAYGSVHHNIFYEITNRCSYMQSILCLWFRAS
jgi:hypothetical protein